MNAPPLVTRVALGQCSRLLFVLLFESSSLIDTPVTLSQELLLIFCLVSMV